MVDFIFLTSLFFITIEFIAYFSILIEQIIFFSGFFILIFISIFFLSFYFVRRKEKFNFNIDILVKYYLFLLKKPSILLNFLKNTFKQIYLFTIHFKYKFTIGTFKIIFRDLLSFFSLSWRPLFKKFSYFGYYRSNRSKWIK